MLFLVLLSVGVWAIALAVGYGWLRAIHYPFSARQRKMWWYYVLVISAIPVLNPIMGAVGRNVLPVNTSVELAVSVLVGWMIVAFFIVRRMSKPGGRLSEEQH